MKYGRGFNLMERHCTDNRRRLPPKGRQDRRLANETPFLWGVSPARGFSLWKLEPSQLALTSDIPPGPPVGP